MKLIENFVTDISKIDIKAVLLKSLRVGMFAFVVSFLISFVISFFINILFLNNVNEIVQGAIGTNNELTLSGVIKTASFVMNISVFNHLESLRFGVLLFAVIPFCSFYFADRKDNKVEGITIEQIMVYSLAAILFSALSMLEALLSKGELIGIQINFFTFGNFLGTLIIAFGIQLIIGLNYNSHSFTGLRATKRTIWILLGAGALISVVGSLYLLRGFTVPVIYKLMFILVLLPNLAVYCLFNFMGISIGLGESLVSALKLVGVNASFGALPLWVKLIVIGIFAVSIIIALLGLEREKYLKHLTVFACSFGVFTFFVAYSTTINLGTVVVLKDVFIGISLLKAFIIPVVTILVFGTLIKLIRDVIGVFKENI